MSYSVGQVSAFAGMTVLSPSDRSHAGYRLYDEADLVRLQQFLFHRELGFPLDEIAAILKDPQVNPLERLRARQRQLNEEIDRLRRPAEVAERAIEVQKTGVSLTPEERFEVFGEVTFDLSYATEAELRWAHSEGRREAMSRADAHTKEDWRRLMGEPAAWRAELLAAFDEGEPSCGGRAMDLAEEHRLHIARWFTSCPPAMHRRIADDFAAAPRAFALVVPPSQQRPGLAASPRRARRPGRAASAARAR
ncbi:MerR family transcriptional regulator [Streptomyces rubrogriseus]|uniref:MerR family transcriptional regulator n=1 Tax=Streptomyces rubrogriseus TaxID=194673 RepID=UPI003702E0B3